MGNCLLFLLLLLPVLLLLLNPLPLALERRGPNLSLKAQILVLGPKSQPSGPNSSLKAQISTLGPISQPQDPNPSLKSKIQAFTPKPGLLIFLFCQEAQIIFPYFTGLIANKKKTKILTTCHIQVEVSFFQLATNKCFQLLSADTQR